MLLKLLFSLTLYLYIRESNELECYSTDETRWNMDEFHTVLVPGHITPCEGVNHVCCYREENYAIRDYNGEVTRHEKMSFKCLKKGYCQPSDVGILVVKSQLARYLKRTNTSYEGKILLYKVLGLECETDGCVPPLSRRSKRTEDTQLVGSPDKADTRRASWLSGLLGGLKLGGPTMEQEDAQNVNLNINLNKKMLDTRDVEMTQPQTLGYREVAASNSEIFKMSIYNLYVLIVVTILRYLQIM